jgi:hypothetical protein
MPGTRIVASPAALDELTVPADGNLPGGVTLVRIAEDELLIVHRGSYMAIWRDEPSIQEPETGFLGWWLTDAELAAVAHHADWPLSEQRPAVAQGLIAGVPARLWLTEDRTLLLVQAAYAHELVERLP